MKTLILLLLTALLFTACSKNKCEGCTVTSVTYLDAAEVLRSSGEVDCGATVGTTVKRAPAAFGKTYTIITTTKCR